MILTWICALGTLVFVTDEEAKEGGATWLRVLCIMAILLGWIGMSYPLACQWLSWSPTLLLFHRGVLRSAIGPTMITACIALLCAEILLFVYPFMMFEGIPVYLILLIGWMALIQSIGGSFGSQMVNLALTFCVFRSTLPYLHASVPSDEILTGFWCLTFVTVAVTKARTWITLKISRRSNRWV